MLTSTKRRYERRERAAMKPKKCLTQATVKPDPGEPGSTSKESWYEYPITYVEQFSEWSPDETNTHQDNRYEKYQVDHWCNGRVESSIKKEGKTHSANSCQTIRIS